MFYRFAKGEMEKCNPPEWFAKTAAKDNDWTDLLKQADAVLVDDFGGDSGGESLQVYRRGAEEYVVVFRDPNQVIMTAFIDDVADYVFCRATYIAPLASLIMEEERQYEWEKNRKMKRAS
jgi:hypothetical protein